MYFVYSPKYCVDLKGHVFQTEKYKLIFETLEKEKIIHNNVFEPEMPKKEELQKILTPDYLDDLLNARLTINTYRSELPVRKDIIEWQMLSCNGSFLAAKLALKGKAAYHIGGGFHHAFSDHAEGFCYLNDIVYATVKLLELGIKKIAIIDCDLHQGNGTAKFFENKKYEKRVFTFSIHQEQLYPIKEKSSLDIGLDFNVGDEEYLLKLELALKQIFSKFKPNFVIYLAGADPYELDKLGNLKLTIEGLKKRDEMVMNYTYKHKAKIITVLGGGYSNLEDIVKIHCNTARVMHKIYG